jgi:hypothetical protein
MKYLTTEKIRAILDRYEKGEGLKRTERIFYHGREGLLNAKYPFLHTKEERIEWVRCHDSPVYFIEQYCRILGGSIELRDYQKVWVDNYVHNRFNVNLTTRQVGYDLIMDCMNLWEMIFHSRSVLSISDRTRGLNKLKELFIRLPYFLKSPVIGWGKKEIRFFGGPMVKRVSGNTKIDTNGFDVVDIRDAFHIPSGKQDDILKVVTPILSGQTGGRLCIGGLPVGNDAFYELTRNPSFVVTRTYWWQVPGRDEEWVEQKKLSCGSEEAFNREYNMSFRSR